MREYTEDITKFPISSRLKEISYSLKKSSTRFLILTAETAAGKSTILPLELLESFSGRIIMTEPRRIAVLGVAERVSQLLGQETGKTVGYKIHLENKISLDTRLEIVTEAVLVRQLQSDPALENYNVVVIDEYHERSVNTDLALAFVKEAMELRDDLFVIIMSATIDTDKIAAYLGSETPVMKIPGRQFPVETIYNSEISVEKAIINELNMGQNNRPNIKIKQQADGQRQLYGNILVFLPGIREIRKVQENLLTEYGEYFENTELCILHSSISLEQQRKILKESKTRRVILSSAIAETSLTVPGVTTVIDSGLARINRINIGAAMEGLYTETETDFSAEQRKGRAGRLMPGRCIRLWSQADPRIKDMPCEILRGDLTELVLECSERGIYSQDKIDWLDCPSEAAWNSSVNLLQLLNMIKEDRRITEKGKTSLKLGIHPRLAGIALAGVISKTPGNQPSMDSSVKLSDKAARLLIKYSSYNKSSPEIKNHFISDIERRIRNNIKLDSCSKLDIVTKPVSNSLLPDSLLILAGYPDRLAKRQTAPGEKQQIYKLAGGRLAVLGDNNKNKSPEWICAPDIIIGQKDAVIFDYEELNKEEVENWLKDKTEKIENCIFENGKINKTENICFGKIVLSSKKIPASEGDLPKAWISEIREKGLECLPLSNKTISLLTRAEFLLNNDKNYIPEIKEINRKNNSIEEYLVDKADEWLPPFLGSSKALTENIVYDSLHWILKGQEVDRKVPSEISLENGKRAKLKYEKLASPDDKNVLIIRPVIEIIIQRIFGCTKTPEICGVKVLLRLLSPASRPLQITDDLAGFWTGSWPEICKEMKGRYPKHNWNEKICTEKGD